MGFGEAWIGFRSLFYPLFENSVKILKSVSIDAFQHHRSDVGLKSAVLPSYNQWRYYFSVDAHNIALCIVTSSRLKLRASQELDSHTIGYWPNSIISFMAYAVKKSFPSILHSRELGLFPELQLSSGSQKHTKKGNKLLE